MVQGKINDELGIVYDVRDSDTIIISGIRAQSLREAVQGSQILTTRGSQGYSGWRGDTDLGVDPERSERPREQSPRTEGVPFNPWRRSRVAIYPVT